tara:strand:- start:372 stop:1814 length:1443 start_codon:yes stop_codon:yes gene_type:complete
LEVRNKFLQYAQNYPLSVSSLWIPHCHRWEGIKTIRERGCGRPMIRINHNIFHCPYCDITEKRTSQRHALIDVSSEACLISGGNRAGKTEIGAQLSVATAASKKEKWVKDWIELNEVPSYLIPDTPTTVWCASLSYKDALEYLRPKLNKYLPIGTKTIRWTSQDRGVATLPNGGRIVSMSCDSGRESFQGGSAKLIWLDEEPNDEGIFNESLLRTVDTNGRVIVTATPLKGLSWLYDRFVEQDNQGFSITKISGLDNPYISSKKMRSTVNHLSEASQRSRLYGEFTAQSGLVYNDFHKATHTIKPFEIPNHWSRYVSIDFGSSHPFCALWFTLAPSGYYQEDEVIIVYRELYWKNKTTIESGREIKRLSKDEKLTWITADPESKDGRLTLARELGLRTISAPKHLGVLEGINMVKDYLHLNQEGRPRIYFFNDLKNLLREFRLYKWDNKSKLDKPKKVNDHAMDSLRYFIMQWVRYNAHQ